MPQLIDPAAAVYDADYYGAGSGTPRANYRNYTGASDPHWARPLAAWLRAHTAEPYLDLGCAYGHLVRELERLGAEAYGVEWSAWATAHRVTPSVLHADARQLARLFPARQFNTIVSQDFLEHLPPRDGSAVLQACALLLHPGGRQLHVIGAHNPADDLSRHLADPTHVNHEALDWYVAQLAATGFVLDAAATALVRDQPAWRDTDWYGRILVFRDARGEQRHAGA